MPRSTIAQPVMLTTMTATLSTLSQPPSHLTLRDADVNLPTEPLVLLRLLLGGHNQGGLLDPSARAEQQSCLTILVGTQYHVDNRQISGDMLLHMNAQPAMFGALVQGLERHLERAGGYGIQHVMLHLISRHKSSSEACAVPRLRCRLFGSPPAP